MAALARAKAARVRQPSLPQYPAGMENLAPTGYTEFQDETGQVHRWPTFKNFNPQSLAGAPVPQQPVDRRPLAGELGAAALRSPFEMAQHIGAAGAGFMGGPQAASDVRQALAPPQALAPSRTDTMAGRLTNAIGGAPAALLEGPAGFAAPMYDETMERTGNPAAALGAGAVGAGIGAIPTAAVLGGIPGVKEAVGKFGLGPVMSFITRHGIEGGIAGGVNTLGAEGVEQINRAAGAAPQDVHPLEQFLTGAAIGGVAGAGGELLRGRPAKVGNLTEQQLQNLARSGASVEINGVRVVDGGKYKLDPESEWITPNEEVNPTEIKAPPELAPEPTDLPEGGDIRTPAEKKADEAISLVQSGLEQPLPMPTDRGTDIPLRSEPDEYIPPNETLSLAEPRPEPPGVAKDKTDISPFQTGINKKIPAKEKPLSIPRGPVGEQGIGLADEPTGPYIEPEAPLPMEPVSGAPLEQSPIPLASEAPKPTGEIPKKQIGTPNPTMVLDDGTRIYGSREDAELAAQRLNRRLGPTNKKWNVRQIADAGDGWAISKSEGGSAPSEQPGGISELRSTQVETPSPEQPAAKPVRAEASTAEQIAGMTTPERRAFAAQHGLSPRLGESIMGFARRIAAKIESQPKEVSHSPAIEVADESAVREEPQGSEGVRGQDAEHIEAPRAQEEVRKEEAVPKEKAKQPRQSEGAAGVGAKSGRPGRAVVGFSKPKQNGAVTTTDVEHNGARVGLIIDYSNQIKGPKPIMAHLHTPERSGWFSSVEEAKAWMSGQEAPEAPKAKSPQPLSPEHERVGIIAGPSLQPSTIRAVKENLAAIVGRIKGYSLPRLVKADAAAGEAGIAHASATIIAQAQAKELSAKISEEASKKVGGKIKLKPDSQLDRLVGAVASEAELRKTRQRFIDEGNLQEAAAVKTLIGSQELPDEAAYQASLKNPSVKAVLDSYRDIAMPVLRDVYKRAGGGAEFNQAGDTDIFISLKRMDPKEPINRGTSAFDVSNKQSSARSDEAPLKSKRSPFARKRTGTATAYDTSFSRMVENSLARQLPIATLREFQEALVKSGNAVIADAKNAPKEIGGEGVVSRPYRDGKMIVEEDTGDVVGHTTGQRIYIRESLAPEVFSAVGHQIGVNLGQSQKILDLVNSAQINIGFADNISHQVRLMGILYSSPGVGRNAVERVAGRVGGLPKLIGMLDSLRSHAWNLTTKNPDTMTRLRELAEIGAMRSPDRTPRETPVGKLWEFITSKPLHAMDAAARLSLDDAFSHLVKSGLEEDTPQRRREFVNQLGQYNLRLQGKLSQVVRQTGIGPFFTAGTAGIRSGVRTITASPRTPGKTPLANANLRIQQAVAIGGTVGQIALLNYLMSGEAFPKGIPPGAVLTGHDEDGKPQYLDALDLLAGGRRGLRAVGMREPLEAMAEGRKTDWDRAKMDVVNTLSRPTLGPGINAAAVAATGHELSMKSPAELRRVSDVAGPGQSQAKKDLAAALQVPFSQIAPTDPNKGTIEQQLSPFVPRTGQIPKKPETQDRLHELGKLNDFVEDLLSRARKLPVNDRMTFVKEEINKLDKDFRERALMKFSTKSADGRKNMMKLHSK